MRRERQEPRVVHGLVAVVAADDDFHVVIKARRRDSAQVLEGADVLAHGGGEVLGLDEVEILPPRVAQHVAEGVHAAAALVAEVQIIGGIIHLCLDPGAVSNRRTGATTGRGRSRRTRSREDRVPSRVTERRNSSWIRCAVMSGYRASRSVIAGS